MSTPDAHSGPRDNPHAGRRFGRYGQCTATNRNGVRCGQHAMGEHGKCYYHGGASSGADEPHRPVGNDHAEGNPGGSPPELNRNAEIHGAFSAMDKVEARLNEDGQAELTERMDALCERSRRLRPSLSEERREALAKEYVLTSHLWTQATVDTLKRGIGITREETFDTPNGPVTVERKRVNPTMLRSSHLIRRQLRIGEVLGLWDETRGPRRPDSPYRRPDSSDSQ